MPVAMPAATDADEDVAVADVADLVGEHAAELVPVEDLQDALGDGDRRVLGVAPGREGVGLHVGRDVQLGHRHAHLLAQLTDDPVVLRHLLLGDGQGPGHLDGELVGEPVGAADHQQAMTRPMVAPLRAEEACCPRKTKNPPRAASST